MNTKHTPGPWEMSERDESDNTLSIKDTASTNPHKRRMVARVSPQPHYADNQKANARLIASAPSLLEALQVLVEQADYAQRYQHGESLETLQRVAQAVLTLGKTAIAKAEGR